MNEASHSILEQISQGENLTLEFKSDRKALSDRDLVAAVTALANTEGGVLLLGVEDDGTITGLHPNHENISGLATLIAGRTYTLSAKLYRKVGQKAEYIRQAGFSAIQQEQMVLSYIDKHSHIKRADVIELCQLSPPQAYRLLKRLREKELIEKTGDRRHAIYTRKA